MTNKNDKNFTIQTKLIIFNNKMTLNTTIQKQKDTNKTKIYEYAMHIT